MSLGSRQLGVPEAGLLPGARPSEAEVHVIQMRVQDRLRIRVPAAPGRGHAVLFPSRVPRSPDAAAPLDVHDPEAAEVCMAVLVAVGREEPLEELPRGSATGLGGPVHRPVPGPTFLVLALPADRAIAPDAVVARPRVRRHHELSEPHDPGLRLRPASFLTLVVGVVFDQGSEPRRARGRRSRRGPDGDQGGAGRQGQGHTAGASNNGVGSGHTTRFGMVRNGLEPGRCILARTRAPMTGPSEPTEPISSGTTEPIPPAEGPRPLLRRPLVAWAVAGVMFGAGLGIAIWLVNDRGDLQAQLDSASSELRQTQRRITRLTRSLERAVGRSTGLSRGIDRCVSALDDQVALFNALAQELNAARSFNRPQARAFHRRAEELRRTANRSLGRCRGAGATA